MLSKMLKIKRGIEECSPKPNKVLTFHPTHRPTLEKPMPTPQVPKFGTKPKYHILLERANSMA